MKFSRAAMLSLAIICLVSSTLALRYLIFPAIFQKTGSADKSMLRELAGAEQYAGLMAGYELDIQLIRSSGMAPPLFSINLPNDLAELPAEEKASLFISLLLPDILRVNADIESERAKMLALLEKSREHRRLTIKERWWLNRLARKYGCRIHQHTELLHRVDTIPVALALAQGINESGWGTSRFAISGNALYGQHLPENSDGKFISSLYGNVRVAAFDSIYQATHSYMLNLNRLRAYSTLRKLRRQSREEGREPTGHLLAEGLIRYSEVGERYVRDLRYLIRVYKLEDFNSIQLETATTYPAVRFIR